MILNNFNQLFTNGLRNMSKQKETVLAIMFFIKKKMK